MVNFYGFALADFEASAVGAEEGVGVVSVFFGVFHDGAGAGDNGAGECGGSNQQDSRGVSQSRVLSRRDQRNRHRQRRAGHEHLQRAILDRPG